MDNYENSRRTQLQIVGHVLLKEDVWQPYYFRLNLRISSIYGFDEGQRPETYPYILGRS